MTTPISSNHLTNLHRLPLPSNQVQPPTPRAGEQAHPSVSSTTTPDLITGATDRLARANRSLAAAQSAESALQRATNLLADLRASLQATPPSAPVVATDVRQRIADIADSIADIATIAAPGRSFGFGALDKANEVRAVSGSTTLPAGTEFDVDVEVITPASEAYVILDIGAPQLDLGGPGEQFVIEVEGKSGVQTFSFASGTSMEDIGASIASFFEQTDVYAFGHSGKVGLITRFGGEEFISVRVLDDGGLEGAEARTGWGEPLGPIETGALISDSGTDLEGRINGIDAESTGFGLRVATADYNLHIELNYGGYFQAQAFTAFRFVATGPDATPTPTQPAPTPLTRAAAEEADAIRNTPPASAAPRIDEALARLRALLARHTDSATLEATRAESLLGTLRSQFPSINLEA